MFFYAVFASTPLLVALAVKLYYQCPIDEDKRAKRAFLFFSGLILFLVIALRDKGVGSADSSNYYRHWDNMAFRNFEGLKENIAKSPMEPGYLCTVWVLSKIFPNPQNVFVFSGLLFTLSACLFIYRNSPNVVLSFIMFITWGMYSFMVQGLRQAIAISICLFSIESVKKRKFFVFLLQILLAMCYHRSAIVFAMVYFIPWKKLSLVNNILMLSAAALLIASSPIIIYVGNEILQSNYNRAFESGGLVTLILHIVLICGSFFFVRHYVRVADGVDYKVRLLGTEQDRRRESLFVTLAVIGFAFYTMRYTGIGAMERISFYFLCAQIITLPIIISRFDKGSRFIICAFAIILSILLFMYRVETTGLVPYKFFFLD